MSDPEPVSGQLDHRGHGAGSHRAHEIVRAAAPANRTAVMEVVAVLDEPATLVQPPGLKPQDLELSGPHRGIQVVEVQRLRLIAAVNRQLKVVPREKGGVIPRRRLPEDALACSEERSLASSGKRRLNPLGLTLGEARVNRRGSTKTRQPAPRASDGVPSLLPVSNTSTSPPREENSANEATRRGNRAASSRTMATTEKAGEARGAEGRRALKEFEARPWRRGGRVPRGRGWSGPDGGRFRSGAVRPRVGPARTGPSRE